MNKGRPFYFDSHIFDALAQQTAEELEKVPKYTEDQLALARSAAFNDGKKAGLAEAQNAVEKEISIQLKNIEQHISKLYAVESVRFERYEAEAVHLSYHIIRHILPLLFDKFGEEQLIEILKQSIIENRSMQSFEVHTHTSKAAILEKTLSDFSKKIGKEIKLSPSASVSKNDCTVTWGYGGALLAPENAALKILARMQEALADRNINVHDTNAGEISET